MNAIELNNESWDVNLNDWKISALLKKHAGIGLLAYYHCVQKAASEGGYYMQWSPDRALEEARCISGRITAWQIETAVNRCLKLSLFDKRIYKKYGILTNSRLQQRWLKQSPENAVDERHLLEKAERLDGGAVISIVESRENAADPINSYVPGKEPAACSYDSGAGAVLEGNSGVRSLAADAAHASANFKPKFLTEEMRFINNAFSGGSAGLEAGTPAAYGAGTPAIYGAGEAASIISLGNVSGSAAFKMPWSSDRGGFGTGEEPPSTVPPAVEIRPAVAGVAPGKPPRKLMNELDPSFEASSGKVYGVNSIERISAKYFIDKMLLYAPNSPVPKNEEELQEWCVSIDEILSIDHRPLDEFKKVLIFSSTDDVWKRLLGNTRDLRRTYNTMKKQMDNSVGLIIDS
ncbi:MAG: DUF4373 domain-containing protein [Clostridiales bacterium]|jgi:hypothetical protein|nr:DUF4373 domain-containing protein [Clostridiales bacterium]